MNSYAKGKYVKITGTFTVNGVATDPTTITLKVQNPSGTETLYTYALAEITKFATGVYYKVLQLSLTGNWYYKWVATGTVADESVDYQIYIQESVF